MKSRANYQTLTTQHRTSGPIEPAAVCGYYCPSPLDREFFDLGEAVAHQRLEAEEQAHARRFVAKGYFLELREVRAMAYQAWCCRQGVPECFVSRIEFLMRAPLVRDSAVRAKYGLTGGPAYTHPAILGNADMLAKEDRALRDLVALHPETNCIEMQRLYEELVALVLRKEEIPWVAVCRLLLAKMGLSDAPIVISLVVLLHVWHMQPESALGRAAEQLLWRYDRPPGLIETVARQKDLMQEPQLFGVARQLRALEASLQTQA